MMVFRYQEVQHPRWGTIVGVVTIRRIKKGEEILCNYGYKIDKQTVPHWYRVAWEQCQ